MRKREAKELLEKITKLFPSTQPIQLNLALMYTAVEFGFVHCERGMSLESTLEKFSATMHPHVTRRRQRRRS